MSKYYFTEYWVKIYSDNLEYAHWDAQLVERHGLSCGVLCIPQEMEGQFGKVDKPRLDEKFANDKPLC